MKNSLKSFASFVGIAGLSLSLSLPALAQTSPSPNDPSPAPRPGAVDRPSRGSSPRPMMDSPSGRTPGGYQAAVSVPAMSQDLSIAAIVDQSSSFEMLNALLRVAAIQNPGLVSQLGSDKKDYTVFAPTDEAFAALPPNAVHALVQPQNRDLLVRLLSYHVVPGDVTSADIAAGNFRQSDRVAANLPPSGNLAPNAIPGRVDRSQAIEPTGSDSLNNGSNGSSASQPNRVAQGGNMSSPGGMATPPSNGQSNNPSNSPVVRGENGINPPTSQNQNAGNENSGTGNMSMGSGNMSGSNMGGSSMSSRPNPSSNSSTSSNSPVVRGENDINPPTSQNQNAGNESSGTGNMSMGSGNMSGSNMSGSNMSGSRSSMEPPSGNLNPNEISGNVDRSQVIEPNSPNSDQHDNMSSNGTLQMMHAVGGDMMVDASSVIGSDIQASNGIIHAINRVIIPADLQADLQQAIAADTTAR